MQNTQANEYDIIISLGEACFVATYLRDSNLRAFSSPFDWLMGGNLQTRLELIKNDFENFFNIEDLAFTTKSVEEKILAQGIKLQQTPFELCTNTRNRLVFNHDFPREKTLEEAFPEVHEKYKRRSERLLETIKNSQSVLLLYVDMPISDAEPIDLDYIIKLLVELNIKFQPAHITLLYLFYKENPCTQLMTVNKYLKIGEYFTTPKMKTKIGGQPDLEEVLKPYNLRTKEKRINLET